MKAWLQKLLFDWVYVLLYRLLQAFLGLVDFIESFFDIFAGTAKVFYKGNSDFLINIFFGHDAVTNAFWAMALIAIVMAFGFCIVQMARKSMDISETVKQSVGQIMSNFFRCLLIIVMLNAVTVAAINISNVLLDRINYALENASVLHQQEEDKTFTEQEYATMTKILATVANYSVNPSADSRYNVNSCFNAIRPDLLSLHVNGFFDYDYPLDDNGHYSWQGALALLATSADLTQDLNLDTYYSDVVTAFQTVSREISTYGDFAPIKAAHFAEPESISTDVLIFLITGMEASQNAMYNTGNFNDAIRKGYVSGDKSYNDLKQVRKDFDIWEMDYLIGYIACIVFVLIMAICIFTFIVRMFNLLLLYITAPLFVSSMPMDDGSKWQSWAQAFVIQLFSGFGMIIAMRLYLIIIPIVISSDLVFFAGAGVGYAILNRMAQLLMILGGAWAVLQAGSVITGILAGNPGMAAIQQEGRIGGMVTGWAMRAPRAAMQSARSLTGSAVRGAKHLAGTEKRRMDKAEGKANLAARKAQQRQNMADAKFAQADKKMAAGASNRSVNRALNSANKAQHSADRATQKADGLSLAAGGKATGIGRSAGRAPGGNVSGGLSAKEIRKGGIGSAGGGQGGHSGGSVDGSGSSNVAPPPTRSRNPYTPEMYDTSHLGAGGGYSHQGSSVSGRAAAFVDSMSNRPAPSGVQDDSSVSYGHPTTRARVGSMARDDSFVSPVGSTAASQIPRGSRADYWRGSGNVSGSGNEAYSGSPSGSGNGVSGVVGGNAVPPATQRVQRSPATQPTSGGSYSTPAPSAYQRAQNNSGVQYTSGGSIKPKSYAPPSGSNNSGSRNSSAPPPRGSRK